MSHREQMKKLVFDRFKDGYRKPIKGYWYYFLLDNNGNYSLEHLTSGLQCREPDIPLPNKYYLDANEIYEDLKLLFNPIE